MESFVDNPIFQIFFVEKLSSESFSKWYYIFYDRLPVTQQNESFYLDLFLFNYNEIDSDLKLNQIMNEYFGEKSIDRYFIENALNSLSLNPKDYYLYVAELFVYATDGYEFLNRFKVWYADDGVEYICNLALKKELTPKEQSSFDSITKIFRPLIVNESKHIIEEIANDNIRFDKKIF